MNGLEIALLAAGVLLGPVAARTAVHEVRHWKHARRIVRMTAAETAAWDFRGSTTEPEFRGSMSLVDEQRAVNENGYLRGYYDTKPSATFFPADPVPYEDLQSDERTGAGEPTAAEVAASRAAHGYIPELDTDQIWADRNAGRFDSALDGPGSDHALSGAPGLSTLASPAPCPVCGGNRWRTMVKGQCWQCRDCGYERGQRNDPGPGGLSSLTPGPGLAWEYHADHPGALPERIFLPRIEHERLADTGDIRDAYLLADVEAFMRRQDAETVEYLAHLESECAQYLRGLTAALA